MLKINRHEVFLLKTHSCISSITATSYANKDVIVMFINVGRNCHWKLKIKRNLNGMNVTINKPLSDACEI